MVEENMYVFIFCSFERALIIDFFFVKLQSIHTYHLTKSLIKTSKIHSYKVKLQKV